jgi:pyruvate dehydrogenase complex dehydrogenase (E1) component
MTQSAWQGEMLDNLIFVVNCNLRRLRRRCAATARSSGARRFRGSGWNVIDLGHAWDLLARDKKAF